MSSSPLTSRNHLLAALAMAALLNVSHALAAGNPENGANVFDEECAECHSVTEGKNKKGPSLFNVVGRQAATLAGFNYSDGMKGSGIRWSADTLDGYITQPKGTVPGGKMKYEGLEDAQARADVIAFLGQQK